MSTRCQIEFKHIWLDGKKKKIERRTVYRHSDGYPNGVIPDLKEFLKWNGGRNTEIEYQTANFIYWSKRHYEELYFNKDWKYIKGKRIEYIKNKNVKWNDTFLGDTNLHLGFGICENDQFHGDIEYYYKVIVDMTIQDKDGFNKATIKIECYKVNWIGKDYSKHRFKKIKEVKVKY